MNKYIRFTVIIISFLGALGTAQAQLPTPKIVEDAITKDGKYAIFAQISRHLVGAVKTGAEIKKKNPDAQFVVGMAGEVVKELAEDDSLKETIALAKKHNIHLVVCEFAMQRLNVNKSDYDPHIETTPNIYRYMFGIKELGFNVLSL